MFSKLKAFCRDLMFAGVALLCFGGLTYDITVKNNCAIQMLVIGAIASIIFAVLYLLFTILDIVKSKKTE